MPFLNTMQPTPSGDAAPAATRVSTQSVIFFSHDELVSHAVTTVCKRSGIPVFATNEHEDIDPIIAQSLARNSLPVLVLDAPLQGIPVFLPRTSLRCADRRQDSYPGSPHHPGFLRTGCSLCSSGIRRRGECCLPPNPAGGKQRWLRCRHNRVSAIPVGIPVPAVRREDAVALLRRLKDSSIALRDLREPPEIALAVLEYAGAMFERAMTLIVRDGEVVAEKSIGVKADRSRGAAPAMGIRIPLNESSLLYQRHRNGTSYLRYCRRRCREKSCFCRHRRPGPPRHPPAAPEKPGQDHRRYLRRFRRHRVSVRWKWICWKFWRIRRNWCWKMPCTGRELKSQARNGH